MSEEWNKVFQAVLPQILGGILTISLLILSLMFVFEVVLGLERQPWP